MSLDTDAAPAAAPETAAPATATPAVDSKSPDGAADAKQARSEPSGSLKTDSPAIKAIFDRFDKAKEAGTSMGEVKLAEDKAVADEKASAKIAAEKKAAKAEPLRENGKFVSAKPKDAPPAAETVKPVDATPAANPAPARPAVAPPQALPAALKEKWATLSEQAPDFAEHYAKQAEETTRVISRMGQEKKTWEDYGQRMSPFGDVVDKHVKSWQDAGFDHPAKAIDALFEGQSFLQKDPVGFVLERVLGNDADPKYTAQFIAALAQAKGIDLAQTVIDGVPGLNRPDQNYLRADSELEQSRREAAQLKAELARINQHLQSQSEQEAMGNSEALVNSVRSKVGEAEFDAVRTRIGQLYPEIEAANPGRHQAELIELAYEQAAWSHPQLRERMLAEQTARSKAEADEAEKKRIAEKQATARKASDAGSLNLRGSPASAGNTQSLRATMDDIWSRYEASKAA